VHALVGVDLDVRPGECLVILGPSGSGKSTLLHMMGGMDRPTAGSVEFRGMDLATLSDADLTRFRRASVAFVFQFYNLIPGLTALENVEMAAEVGEAPRDPRAMLEQVALATRADHFPSQLSGGEQQRIAIARAAAKGARVLLCDEPTGALDRESGRLVLTLLRDLCKEYDTTLVVITHNAAIGAMGDRVLKMSSGKIVEVVENPRPATPGEIDW